MNIYLQLMQIAAYTAYRTGCAFNSHHTKQRGWKVTRHNHISVSKWSTGSQLEVAYLYRWSVWVSPACRRLIGSRFRSHRARVLFSALTYKYLCAGERAARVRTLCFSCAAGTALHAYVCARLRRPIVDSYVIFSSFISTGCCSVDRARGNKVNICVTYITIARVHMWIAARIEELY